MDVIFHAIHIVAGIVIVVILPGLLASYIIFGDKYIDYIERLIISISLSLVLSPFIVFIANLMQIPINYFSIIAEIGVLIIIEIAILLFVRKLMK